MFASAENVQVRFRSNSERHKLDSSHLYLTNSCRWIPHCWDIVWKPYICWETCNAILFIWYSIILPPSCFVLSPIILVFLILWWLFLGQSWVEYIWICSYTNINFNPFFLEWNSQQNTHSVILNMPGLYRDCHNYINLIVFLY